MSPRYDTLLVWEAIGRVERDDRRRGLPISKTPYGKVFTNMHLRRNLPENSWFFPNLGMVVGLAIGSKFSRSYNDPNFGTHFLLSALNWSRKSIALFPGVI